MTHTQFVEFAYKTNRIYNFRVPTPSHPPPGIKFVEFVYEFQIRGRIGNHSFRYEFRLCEIRLYEFQFVHTNFVLAEIRIRNWRISLNSYDEFRGGRISSIRISSPNQFVYTKFVSRGTNLARDEFRIRKFVYEFTFGDEIRVRNSYPNPIRQRIFVGGGSRFKLTLP